MPRTSAARVLLPPVRDEHPIDVAALEDGERRPVLREQPDGCRPSACVARRAVTSGGSRRRDHAFARQQHRPLHDVRELAHVARELVAPEHSCTSGATRGAGRPSRSAWRAMK